MRRNYKHKKVRRFLRPWMVYGICWGLVFPLIVVVNILKGDGWKDAIHEIRDELKQLSFYPYEDFLKSTDTPPTAPSKGD